MIQYRENHGLNRGANVRKYTLVQQFQGYGFIGRENGTDVFVHYMGIVGDGYRTLQQGGSVEFEIAQGPKGLPAVNVQKTGPHQAC